MFERVLRGDHEEGGGKWECLIAYRHLSLFHGFEEGRLDFRRSTVDLVGEEDTREYRSLAYLELACLRFIYLCTSEVGRQEIWGE